MKEIWELRPGEYYPPLRRLQTVIRPPASPAEKKKEDTVMGAFRDHQYYLERKAAYWMERYSITDRKDEITANLMAEGLAGFMDAMKTFDPGHKVSLKTYADKFVDSRMKAYLKDETWIRKFQRLDAGDEDDGQEKAVSEELMIQIQAGMLNLMKGHSLMYIGPAEEEWFRLERMKEALRIICRLDKPYARYMLHKYYESRYKKRKYFAKYFNIDVSFAEQIEKKAMNQLRDYYEQEHLR